MFYSLLALLLLLSFPLLADPECPPESKASESATTSPSSPAPSASPQEGGTSKEPSTTKDQIGLTFEPPSTIPDILIIDEKNPDRKRLLDKIFEAEKKEVEAQIRLDEIERLEKDCGERIQKVFAEDKKLLDELEKENDHKARMRLWNELFVNWERVKSIQKQKEALEEEWTRTLRRQTDYIFEKMGWEEGLRKFDERQKEASRQDAEKASVPDITKGDEEF